MATTVMATSLPPSLFLSSSSKACKQNSAQFSRLHLSGHSQASATAQNSVAMSRSGKEMAVEVGGISSRDMEEKMVDSRRGFFRMAAVLGLGRLLGSGSDHCSAVESLCEEFTVAPSGLRFCDTVLGSGAPASKGMLIKAHYTGTLENGQVFDSSYKRGKPLIFRIGVGEVIKGWDEGILGTAGVPPMLAGGKRKLKIPPELGYGERGAGCIGGSCIIPPNSVLLFDVEFVGKA